MSPVSSSPEGTTVTFAMSPRNKPPTARQLKSTATKTIAEHALSLWEAHGLSRIESEVRKPGAPLVTITVVVGDKPLVDSLLAEDWCSPEDSVYDEEASS